MSTEYLIIVELVAVLIIVLLVAVVLWRDKSLAVKELQELNLALFAQVDELQHLLNGQKAKDMELAATLDVTQQHLDEQLDQALDHLDDNHLQMERLVHQQVAMVAQLGGELSQPDLEIDKLNAQLEALKNVLSTTENKLTVHKNELKTSKKRAKSLKEKLAVLSKQVKELKGADVREGRLQRDKSRLKNRFDELNKKYQDSQLLNRSLQQELKTSFRASEVAAIKQELHDSEEALKRALLEKQFIEQHFVDLDESSEDDLTSQLERAKREISLLEQVVLELDGQTK